MVYKFLFQELVLMEAPESILYFPWFLVHWTPRSSLIISYWLTLDCCQSKMLITELTMDLCDLLIAEWEANSKSNQYLVYCSRVRCCFVFIAGYNHSKNSFPSSLNLLAATEAYLDRVRTDVAHHIMFQLCPGMKLISVFPWKIWVWTAEVSHSGADGGPRVNTPLPLIPHSINAVNWSGNKRMQMDKGSPSNTKGDHHRESWFALCFKY